MIGTAERKKALTRTSNICILASIVLVLVNAGLISSASQPHAAGGAFSNVMFLILTAVAVVLWFVGLGYYALSKGYSAVFAALALLSIFGLLILIVMPNRYKIQTDPVVDPNSNYPRPPRTM